MPTSNQPGIHDERDVLLDVIGQPHADDLRRRMQRIGLCGNLHGD
jgi:hypothetical protein